MSIDVKDSESIEPDMLALLEKVEQMTKDSIIELYYKFNEIKGDNKVSMLIEFSFFNYVLMHIKSISSMSNMTPLQVYSQFSDKIISCL